MDLYGRPPSQRTPSPAVAFLNEKPKSLSFSAGFKAPNTSRRRNEDEVLLTKLPDCPSSNQQQQQSQQTQQQPSFLHQRPASSRFLNRPQSSSGVRRPESFTATKEPKQRPRTARDGVRTLPTTQTFLKRATCFTPETEITAGPEIDQDSGDEQAIPSPTLDELYLLQLKADISHLHRIHQQLEKEKSANENNGARSSTASVTQAPNHVKNLLHRDTKAYLGWNSPRDMDLNQDDGTATSTASIQAQLLRCNYSSNPAQLAATKVELEGLLAETLISLMEVYLAHGTFDEDGSADSGTGPNVKMKLVRPPNQHSGHVPSLPFANGCGTSPVSIFAGGILTVLQQTEVFKRTMLASTGERKLLVKAIADKDTELKQLTEQIDVFKDTLAQRRPRYERSKQVRVLYEEREQENAPEPSESADINQLKLTLATEQAQLAALKKDRVESILLIQELGRQKEELELQLGQANVGLRDALGRLETAEKHHLEAMATADKSSQTQIEAVEKRTADLHSSLVSSMERYRTLELSAAQEKAQLRRDNQELERLLRLKEDEAGQRQAQATAKAEAQAQSGTAQLKLVTNQLDHAMQTADDLRLELKAAYLDNKQIQSTVRSLHHDLKVRNEDVERLTSKLAAANAIAESKTTILQQTQARIETSAKEIKQKQVLLEEQAQQMQLLEAKLSRSVPVDDEELQSRQQREESAWHQRVSAMEHALVAERQHTALFREQQRKAVTMEQEKAMHAVEQAQAVAAELATANLCLLERKRQREQEQKAFEEKVKESADRIAELSSDQDTLQRELDALRSQLEQMQQTGQQSAEQAGATEKTLREELASVKEELKNLTEIRENLDRALAHALATPRGKSARHQASLSEVRAELQKAKQKIAALEEQVSRNGNFRTSKIDSKLAELSARERRFTEEQRGLKKQRTTAMTSRLQIEKERADLDKQRELQTAVESKQNIDHELLQQIIVLLAHRLQLLMALFDTEPTRHKQEPPDASQDSTTPLNAAAPEDVESWREMQQQWEDRCQELQEADWKLEDMRSKLEALHYEYLGYPLAPLGGEQQSSRSSLLSGFHGPNPFSDAVAAGRETVPVAEQLKASRLLRRLSLPGESPENRARQVKAEDHETFAVALAREMTTMKESYERQLEELRDELRKTQQVRLLTSQRLRAELANERSRSKYTATQLSERIAELEAALVAQEKALADAQTQQQAILDQHAAATNEDERQKALQSLVELVGSEQRQRERERLAKLLAYCGASSVTVERRDRALEEETVDEVLARLHAEEYA